MRSKVNRGIPYAVAAVLLATPVLAQDNTGGAGADLGASVRPQEAPGEGIGPLIDKGNEFAKAMAARLGISVGEATRRLNAMQAASRISGELEQQNPDAFAGVEVRNDRNRFRVIGKFKRGAAKGNFREKARAANIENDVEEQDAALSFADERRITAALLPELRKVSPKTKFSVDRTTGDLILYTSQEAIVRPLVATVLPNFAGSIRIEAPLEIVETENAVAGSSWAGQSGSLNSCTIGFTVTNVSTNVKGTTTAGHCANSSPSEFNPYNRAYSGSSALRLNFQQKWTTNGMDVQWFTAASSTAYLAPYYWDGTRSIPVTGRGVGTPPAGVQFCAYGKTTNRLTCGEVSPYLINDPAYGGTFSQLISTGGNMSQGGDSGGPVVQANTAWGWIHGYSQSTGNLIFMPVQKLYDNSSLRVVVCTANC